MENKRSGRSAAADTPFVTIPRSGDWTTRSQRKLAEFHVISEDNQTEDDGRRQLVGPGARKFLREDTNWGWWGTRGRGVKKNKGEDDGKLHREDDASAIYTRQCATSGCDASKSARAHWLPRVPARRQPDPTSEYGSDYLPPPTGSSKTILMMSHSCIKKRNNVHF